MNIERTTAMPSEAEKERRREILLGIRKREKVEAESRRLEEQKAERVRALEYAILSIPEKLDRISSRLESSGSTGDDVRSMIQEIRDKLCGD